MMRPLAQIEGKYEILHKIKDGGMGAIYKVRHRLLEELRVIKTIRPQFADDAELHERFLREAKTAIRLRHPNIAQLYDFSLDSEGTAYIVMEYIDGVTFQELLSRAGPPPISLTLELTRQALEALEFLHRRGFVHRDVAPDNLMVTRGLRGLPDVKLIDLGIAKRLESAGVDLTATGTFLGKVRYAAPEQFSDTSGVDVGPWSDVYSFGVMLYELLTGRLPYTGENMHQLMAGHLFRPPLPFEETDPESRVSEEIREVVLRALAKEPTERIRSAESLASRLAPLRKADPAVLREDLERTLHTATTRRLKAGTDAEPGSTQERLAEQFGLERTPAPETAERPLRPRRIETRAEEIASRLAEARSFARQEDFHRAKEELESILAIDPETDEAEQLLGSVEAVIRQREEDARQRAEAALREQREARELERRHAVDAAVANIEEHLLEGRLETAAEEIENAVRELGGEERFQELREEVDREVGQRREEARKAEALRAAVGEVAKRISHGELEEAERRLGQARDELGENQELEAAEKAIAERRAEAEEHLTRARETAPENPVEAERILQRALALFPGLPAAREFLETVTKRLRVQAREEAIREAVRSISDRITEGELDQASDELKFARSTYEGHPEIERMSDELEWARRSAKAREQADAARAVETARAHPEEVEPSGGPVGDESDVREREEAARPGEEDVEATVLTPPPSEVATAPTLQGDTLEMSFGPDVSIEESPPPTDLDASAAGRYPVPRWAWGVAAGIAVLLVLGLIWRSAASPDETAPGGRIEPGYLVLDALPWGEITEIRSSEGELVPLDGPRHTPARLDLPPGSYSITLTHPSLQEPREVTADIRAGESTRRLVEFEEIDVDDYLERVGL